MSNNHQVIQRVFIELLTPHPINASIYGANEDVSGLVELISESDWVGPLIVTPDYVIVSGHKRWKACQILGKEDIPVVFREFPNEIAILKTLLLENASRNKTIEQRIREGMAWESIEQEKARERQGTRTDLKNIPENFPECSTGDSRDAIASRVGLGSGRTYSKAAKVVMQIDEDTNLGHLEVAQVLRKVLNEQSVDAAHTLLKKTLEERQAIAELIISGKAKSTKAAAKMIQQNNHAEFQDPRRATLAEFSVGDWVTVNEQAQSPEYIGNKGQVEQLWPIEQQISVKFGDSPDKARFHPFGFAGCLRRETLLQHRTHRTS